MTKVTIDKVLNNPIDYLYLFATDKFLSYLGGKQVSTIRSKRENQKKFCNTVAVENGSTLAELKPKISAAIEEQYGYSPIDILQKLALGESVAGKNWAEGIYGVGATEHTNFATGTDVTVDASTGKILQNGIEVPNQTATYKTYGKYTYVAGWSAEVNGTQYSSTVRGTTYMNGKPKYNSATYSTADKQCKWNGSAFTPKDASSLWESINTFMPQFQVFLEWLVSLFTNSTLLTTRNTAPAQTEFIETTDNDFASIAIVGAALVGGYLLLSDNKKSKKK